MGLAGTKAFACTHSLFFLTAPERDAGAAVGCPAAYSHALPGRELALSRPPPHVTPPLEGETDLLKDRGLGTGAGQQVASQGLLQLWVQMSPGKVSLPLLRRHHSGVTPPPCSVHQEWAQSPGPFPGEQGNSPGPCKKAESSVLGLHSLRPAPPAWSPAPRPLPVALGIKHLG